jgi:hypothetical protein
LKWALSVVIGLLSLVASSNQDVDRTANVSKLEAGGDHPATIEAARKNLGGANRDDAVFWPRAKWHSDWQFSLRYFDNKSAPLPIASSRSNSVGAWVGLDTHPRLTLQEGSGRQGNTRTEVRGTRGSLFSYHKMTAAGRVCLSIAPFGIGPGGTLRGRHLLLSRVNASCNATHQHLQANIFYYLSSYPGEDRAPMHWIPGLVAHELDRERAVAMPRLPDSAKQVQLLWVLRRNECNKWAKLPTHSMHHTAWTHLVSCNTTYFAKAYLRACLCPPLPCPEDERHCPCSWEATSLDAWLLGSLALGCFGPG